MRERTKVVRAKAERPRGAGLANLRLGGLGPSQAKFVYYACVVVHLRIKTRLELTAEGDETVLLIGTPVCEGVTTCTHEYNVRIGR